MASKCTHLLLLLASPIDGLFQFKAEGLKADNYMAGCHANSAAYPMEWLDENDGDALKTITYSTCRPLPSSGKVTEVDPAWKKDSANRKNTPNMPLDPGKCKYNYLV